MIKLIISCYGDDFEKLINNEIERKNRILWDTLKINDLDDKTWYYIFYEEVEEK